MARRGIPPARGKKYEMLARDRAEQHNVRGEADANMSRQRKLSVIKSLDGILDESPVPLLLLGILEDRECTVLGTVAVSNGSVQSQSEELERLLPWPVRVVGWAQAGSPERAPGPSTDTPILQRTVTQGRVWSWEDSAIPAEVSLDWRSKLYPTRVLIHVDISRKNEVNQCKNLLDALHSRDVQLLAFPHDEGGQASSPSRIDDITLSRDWNLPSVVQPYVPVSDADGSCTGPILHEWMQDGDGHSSAHVRLDALAYVPRTASAETVRQVLVGAVERLLVAVRDTLRGTISSGGDLLVQTPAFLLPGWDIHILPVLVSPIDAPMEQDADSTLAARRRDLHALLGLPLDRPFLRLAQSVRWGSSIGPLMGSAGGRLRNVHLLLPQAQTAGSTIHMVSGSYDYYHYMQDRTNDSGWGCAYRSLQTIWSWFVLAHYTSRDVPGHREIQAQLVKLGDKTPEFMGSRQWIGAIELSYIFDEMLDISSRVLSVRSGDDIPTLAHSLAKHFDTQGTPIMIGGGVLAYTLLGIEWNQATGDVSFLILDPHFTGFDDPKKVLSGGWIAWKKAGDRAAAGGELFVSGAHYNFLCPQRPSVL